MTLYLLLNDLHLSERTEETVFTILTYAALKSTKTDCKVAILGDFYDTVYKDGQIDARLQQRTYDFFAQHFRPDTLHLLPGNHDIYNGYSENALTVFSSVATVHDEPELDGTLLWLPYRDGGYTSSMIKKWRKDGATVCFTHNDFKYLHTRKNHMSQEGMDPEIFEGYVVYNGHYHYPNIYDHRVICMGSQYPVHKTELFDQKKVYYVTVYNDETRRVSKLHYENVRFGRREFVYPIDYAKDLYDEYWLPYLQRNHGKSKDIEVPPPTFPTIQDTLVLEHTCPEIGEVTADTSYFEKLNCLIVTRKAPDMSPKQNDSSEITLDTSVYDNIKHAVKDLYEFSPDLMTTSLKQIEDCVVKEYNTFQRKEKSMVVEKTPTVLDFKQLTIQNFCNIKCVKIIEFDKKTTKIVGPNGCGKTIQYATALLYCISGVIDDRFSEEKLVLADVRCNDDIPSIVRLSGEINNKHFILERSYDGKSHVKFLFDSKEQKHSTLKQLQKAICNKFFNIHVPEGTCPNRFTQKLMLQRFVWKQGGRDSNILKLNNESLQTHMLQLFNKGHYLSFVKHIKSKIAKLKKTITKTNESITFYKILLDERKEVSSGENTMLEAWVTHRKDSLMQCKEELSDISKKRVDKNDIDAYIEHQVKIKTLEARIKYLLESKEGTRWTPELSLNKLEDAYKESEVHYENLLKTEKEVRELIRCVETFKHLQKSMYSKICDIMKNYSNVNLSPQKIKKLHSGECMKYLSGGEYEKESLQLYLDMQRFLKEYFYWESNVYIFDEPGTAMSTEALQKFADGLQKNKCNFIITHKPIKCEVEVKLT